MVAEPDPYDVRIAARIALARNLRGETQQKLAGFLGLTYQQVQKYERGENRVSGGRLFRIAKHYDLPVAFFFEGIEEDEHVDQDIGSTRSGLDLMRSFHEISDPTVRTRISGLIKSLARFAEQDSSR
jgi:transcriptional regulator with XRE-family HTH domain